MNRIKVYIVQSILLLTMSGVVSCENNILTDAPNNSSSNEVRISATIGDGNWNALSRRDITYDGVVFDEFQPNHTIGVFGYYIPYGTELEAGDEPDFMNNQPMTYDGTTWNYSPVKYWPNNPGDRLAFWAYYPHNMKGMDVAYNIETRQPRISFANDSYFYEDVMVADMVTSEKMAVNGSVPLNFRHIMSKVNLIIKFGSFKETDGSQSIPNPTLKLKDVKYHNIPVAGTFTGFDADGLAQWEDIVFKKDDNISLWVDRAIYELKPGEEVFIDQDYTFFIPFYVNHLSFVPLIVPGEGGTAGNKYHDDNGLGTYDEANFQREDNDNDEEPDPDEFDFYLSNRGFGENGIYLAPGTETTIKIIVGLYGIDNVETSQRPIAKWQQTSHTDVYY